MSPVHRRTGDREVASGRSPDPGTQVVGREAELERLDSLLRDARDGRAGVLLLEGDAGIGKTTLLDAAAARADGFRVLRATGVEADAVLPYGGLLELLGPLRSRAAELPTAEAAALAQVLGWDRVRDEAVDRFLVAAASLSLLAEAAEAGPVLLLVDDLMWLDLESASALLFAVRRLAQDRVAVLLAIRTGAGEASLVDGLPVLPVAGLGEREPSRCSAVSATRSCAGCTARPGATRWPCWRSPDGHGSPARRGCGAAGPVAGGWSGRPRPRRHPRRAASRSRARRPARGAAPAARGPGGGGGASCRGIEPAAALDEAVDHAVLRSLPGGGHDFRTLCSALPPYDGPRRPSGVTPTGCWRRRRPTVPQTRWRCGTWRAPRTRRTKSLRAGWSSSHRAAAPGPARPRRR